MHSVSFAVVCFQSSVLFYSDNLLIIQVILNFGLIETYLSWASIPGAAFPWSSFSISSRLFWFFVFVGLLPFHEDFIVF